VVTGGGLASDGRRWIEGGRRFFLPVKVIAALFRGKFLAGVKTLHRTGQLKLAGSVKDLNDAGCFRHWLRELYAQRWVVYAKRPFGGPEQVFRYLGRYTHRVAITNSRLLAMAGGRVAFEWKDYAHGHAKKVMSLEVDEFIRRFLLHVLPRGFVRIRHYGLMASGNVSGKLAWCRAWLEARQPREGRPATCPSWLERIRQELAEPPRCPRCQGELVRIPFEAPRVVEIETFPCRRAAGGDGVATACCDTS
jgi:Putative transposase